MLLCHDEKGRGIRDAKFVGPGKDPQAAWRLRLLNPFP
jgi:hypothetical protein